MKMINLPGKLTISRISCNYENDYIIQLEISDEVSGINIIQCEISPEELMLALTSFANRPVVIKKIIEDEMSKNLGKEKIIKTVFITKPPIGLNKEERKKYVKENIKDYLVDGLMLWDDGVSSQQPQLDHRVTLYKYK